MFIWVGCKLPEEYQQEIRNICLEQNNALNLDTVAFSLPQHISLKISFEFSDYEAVLDALTDYLSAQKSFSVCMQNPQQEGNILWLPVAENETLIRLHAQLDDLLENRFGIPQHPFDKAFLFHSTLFMDADTEKIWKMQELLTPFSMQRTLAVDTFLLGLSETGKPGQCRIVRQIKV